MRALFIILFMVSWAQVFSQDTSKKVMLRDLNQFSPSVDKYDIKGPIKKLKIFTYYHSGSDTEAVSGVLCEIYEKGYDAKGSRLYNRSIDPIRSDTVAWVLMPTGYMQTTTTKQYGETGSVRFYRRNKKYAIQTTIYRRPNADSPYTGMEIYSADTEQYFTRKRGKLMTMKLTSLGSGKNQVRVNKYNSNKKPIEQKDYDHGRLTTSKTWEYGNGGKIKKETTLYYGFPGIDDRTQEAVNIYDTGGNIVEEFRNIQGNPYSHSVHKFDTHNNEILYEQYSANGDLDYAVKTDYDTGRRMLQVTSLDNTRIVTGTHTYKYNDNGLLVERRWLRPTTMGQLRSKQIYGVK